MEQGDSYGPPGLQRYVAPSSPPAAATPRCCERFLARVGARRRRCVTCRAWSWTAGQRAIAANPLLGGAAVWLDPVSLATLSNPTQAAEEGRVDENGQVKTTLDRALDRALDWSEFGACAAHAELRHASDGCEEWR